VWEIEFSRRVLKDVRKLPKELLARVREKLELVKQDPWKYSEPLVNLPYRKIRVGDYRVIVDVRPQERKIIVLMIEHRKKVYKRLWKL